jgi:2,3-diaminopropionate biosynthesis protein SbnB
VRLGLDRASAVLVFNSNDTGQPAAVVEGSIISAKRTAASAALAAMHLHVRESCILGVIGCGYINYEILRFLAITIPGIEKVMLYDQDPAKALRIRHQYQQLIRGVDVEVVKERDDVLRNCNLISFATTATTPYLDDLSMCPLGCTILHISLRDLTAKAILGSDNVVDDVDHVCRAATSAHLAETEHGSRDFIRCSLGDILGGVAPAKVDGASVTVFSPFGLGILDLAVGDLVISLALEQGVGTELPTFLPNSWIDPTAALDYRDSNP